MRRYARSVTGGLRGLRSRFRPSFGGYVSVTVVYDPESRIFTIRAYNEYGDSAYLSEDMSETRSLLGVYGLVRQ